MVKLILVDKNGNETGQSDVTLAHMGGGILHRAFSCLLFRQNGEIIETLIQRRSSYKLLWPMFWSNTVCSHPRPGEDPDYGVTRRLKEEFGIKLVKSNLTHIYTFTYHESFSDKWSEYENDWVFGVWLDVVPTPDEKEISEWKWIGWEMLSKDMEINAGIYTPWFKMIVKSGEMNKYIKNKII